MGGMWEELSRRQLWQRRGQAVPSIYGHNPAPLTSAADSAAPRGLEFWLPGKVSIPRG